MNQVEKKEYEGEGHMPEIKREENLILCWTHWASYS
jgi:hypothetical protein